MSEEPEGDVFREDLRRALEDIARYRMPFGKFGPKEFPPDGKPLYDLPWEYLHWFKERGWPNGRLGELMEIVYHIKGDGAEEIFSAMRKKG